MFAHIIVGRGRADIADQMAHRRARRIKPRKPALRHDTGQFGQAHADGGKLVPVELARHFHRLKPARLADLVPDIGDMIGRQVKQTLQCCQCRIGIGQPIGDQVDAKIRAVGRNRHAIAIEHPAAPGRDQRKVDAVAFRRGGIFGILRHRQIAKAPGEQQPDPALNRAEQERAPLECLRQPRGGHRQFAGIGRFGGHYRRRIGMRRKRSSTATSRLITGNSTTVVSNCGPTVSGSG